MILFFFLCLSNEYKEITEATRSCINFESTNLFVLLNLELRKSDLLIFFFFLETHIFSCSEKYLVQNTIYYLLIPRMFCVQ